MSGIHRIALAAIATAFPLLSAAADEVRYNFECDTPAAHVAHWNRSVSSTDIAVSGKLTLGEAREHKKWAPLASVSLRKGKDRTGRFGIRFLVSEETPGEISVDLMKIGGHIAVGKGSISKSKKQIPFTLRLDATGLLTVTVAGAEASAMIGPFQPEVFELSCSTAEFSFTDVIVVENSRRER